MWSKESCISYIIPNLKPLEFNGGGCKINEVGNRSSPQNIICVRRMYCIGAQLDMLASGIEQDGCCQGGGSSTTSNSRHFMAMSLLRKHQIFMQALAGLRYIKTGCSDARGFAASPLTQAFTVMGLKKGSSGICLDVIMRELVRPGRAPRQSCIFAPIGLRLMVL